jgi:hypothetical protein
MSVKFQISISIKGQDPATNFSFVDAGVALELSDHKTANELYRLLDGILRDAGARQGANRRGAVNVKPIGVL